MTTTPEPTPGLVSVVLPTFNREQTLARAVASVLNQSYRDLELIVVDDGSTDRTAEVMAGFDDPRLRYLRLEKNGGASRARNAGLRAAKGEFIAFQDSDDEWLVDKLARQLELARSAGPEPVTVICMKVTYGIDEKRNAIGPDQVGLIPLLPEGMTQQDYQNTIYRENFISTQTLMFSHAALQKSGYFDECLANSVDWDFSIRLIHNTRVLFAREPLCIVYTQHDSISRRKRSACRSQLRICQKLARNYPAPPKVLADRLGRLGMALNKFGMPLRGRRLLRRAMSLDPTNPKNLVRWAATEAGALVYPLKRREVVKLDPRIAAAPRSGALHAATPGA
jgi:glycosyltransferase involved in cell wall biosynthesis